MKKYSIPTAFYEIFTDAQRAKEMAAWKAQTVKKTTKKVKKAKKKK